MSIDTIMVIIVGLLMVLTYVIFDMIVDVEFLENTAFAALMLMLCVLVLNKLKNETKEYI